MIFGTKRLGVVLLLALGLAGANALRLWEPEILPPQHRWLAAALFLSALFAHPGPILAQIDSPPAYVHDRLAFQVNRLQEHMTTGERDPLAGASRLVELWYLTGPAPATAMADLETRFERARAALSVTQADIPER